MFIFLLLFIIKNFADPLPEMRSIACWVLSRYCCLFADMPDVQDGNNNNGGGGGSSAAGDGRGYYLQSLQVLLSAMFDAKPKVQVAACSALCVLVENSFYCNNNNDSSSSNVLSGHLPAILTAISRAFELYGVKSALILVDTIGTLADTVGEELRLLGPQCTALYLPRLMQKFGELEDYGKLSECAVCCVVLF